jgi:hypothetical protein
LFSHLLSKNLRIKIYKTTILPTILYGCETLREEHKSRAFQKRVMRRTFESKGEKWQEAGEYAS